MIKLMKAFIVSTVLVTGVGFSASSALADDHKVTICHAAGQAGTDQFVTITIAESAVYAAHFNDNGTPRAGHEGDYFGPCEPDETTTTTVEEEETTTTVEEVEEEETTTTLEKEEIPMPPVPPVPPVLVENLTEVCIQRDGTVLTEGNFVRLSNADFRLSTGTTRQIVMFCGPIVEVGRPPVVQTPAPVATQAPAMTALPETGAEETGMLAVIASLLLGAGFVLTKLARRTVA